MAHETHNDGHHQPTDIQKSKTSFSASFWFVIILVFLFIAAVNFVDVMGHDSSEGHGEGHTTEAVHEGHGAATHEEHATEATHHEGAAEEHTENHNEGETEHSEGH